MGWSCTARAGLVFDALGQEFNQPTSNGLPGGGFYEAGREQDDGAIVGSVWRPLNAAERARWAHLDRLDERVVRAGSFRIAPDGRIVRFPRTTAEQRRRAEERGAAMYRERFETPRTAENGWAPA